MVPGWCAGRCLVDAGGCAPLYEAGRRIPYPRSGPVAGRPWLACPWWCRSGAAEARAARYAAPGRTRTGGRRRMLIGATVAACIRGSLPRPPRVSTRYKFKEFHQGRNTTTTVATPTALDAARKAGTPWAEGGSPDRVAQKVARLSVRNWSAARPQALMFPPADRGRVASGRPIRPRRSRRAPRLGCNPL